MRAPDGRVRHVQRDLLLFGILSCNMDMLPEHARPADVRTWRQMACPLSHVPVCYTDQAAAVTRPRQAAIREDPGDVGPRWRCIAMHAELNRYLLLIGDSSRPRSWTVRHRHGCKARKSRNSILRDCCSLSSDSIVELGSTSLTRGSSFCSTIKDEYVRHMKSCNCTSVRYEVACGYWR